MPNVKSGTLVDGDQLEETVNALKGGRIEIKADAYSVLKANIGKRKFTKEQLYTNLEALIKCVVENKPAKTKGDYLKSCKLQRSQGSAINVDVESIAKNFTLSV